MNSARPARVDGAVRAHLGASTALLFSLLFPALAEGDATLAEIRARIAQNAGAGATSSAALALKSGLGASTNGGLEEVTALAFASRAGAFRAGVVYGFTVPAWSHLAAFTIERPIVALPTFVIVPGISLGATLDAHQDWSPDARLTLSLQAPFYRVPMAMGICGIAGWNESSGFFLLAGLETAVYLR